MIIGIIDYGQDLDTIISIVQSFNVFSFHCFQKSEDFYLEKDAFDAILMEIDILNDNGLILAKKLRNAKWDKPIIFVTKYKEFAFESFLVRPFRFVRKQYFTYELTEALTALLYEEQKLEKVFVINMNQSTIPVPVKHILYFEREIDYVYMHTDLGKTVKLSSSLTEILEQKINCFMRINKSVIINLNKANKIEGDQVVLDNNVKIEVSRRRKAELKTSFYKIVLCDTCE